MLGNCLDFLVAYFQSVACACRFFFLRYPLDHCNYYSTIAIKLPVNAITAALHVPFITC